MNWQRSQKCVMYFIVCALSLDRCHRIFHTFSMPSAMRRGNHTFEKKNTYYFFYSFYLIHKNSAENGDVYFKIVIDTREEKKWNGRTKIELCVLWFGFALHGRKKWIKIKMENIRRPVQCCACVPTIPKSCRNNFVAQTHILSNVVPFTSQNHQTKGLRWIHSFHYASKWADDKPKK